MHLGRGGGGGGGGGGAGGGGGGGLPCGLPTFVCGPIDKALAMNACAVRVQMGLDDMMALEALACRLHSTVAAALQAFKQVCVCVCERVRVCVSE